MNLLLYGQDSFRSRQKLSKILEKYQNTQGSLNLVILSGEDITFEEILRQAQAQPFLSQKRLLVIKDLLQNADSNLQNKLKDTIDNFPESTLTVFYESSLPDSKNPLFLKLRKKGFYEEFSPLKGYSLKKWVQNYAEKEGGQISPDALELLSDWVGSDLFRMKQELDKLLNYDSKITPDNVRLLVKPKIESDIFGLIDALGRKDGKRAFGKLYNLILNGEDEFYIFSMIVYQFRNLLTVKDLLEQKKDNWVILKRSGLHPFVLQKTTSQAQNFTLSSLKEIYRKILDFDLGIKTGKIDIDSALDLLVGRLSI